MDEAAIRMWAWDTYSGWSTRETDEEGKETFKSWQIDKRMAEADKLAAWVMSGKLPDATD